MLRLAILTARGRLAAFTGALVALIAASVLTMAWGMQLEAVLRGHAARRALRRRRRRRDRAAGRRRRP